jgi:protein KRI1
MDEYYQLDFEDLIGSLPVRFKYKKVVPDSYTLTPEEILQAEDEDLNNVVSLKKLGPYRSNEQKAVDDLKWKKSKKRKLWEFRSKLKGGEGLKNNQIEESDIGVNAILKDAKIEGKRLDSYAATSTVKKAKSKKSKR